MTAPAADIKRKLKPFKIFNGEKSLKPPNFTAVNNRKITIKGTKHIEILFLSANSRATVSLSLSEFIAAIKALPALSNKIPIIITAP